MSIPFIEESLQNVNLSELPDPIRRIAEERLSSKNCGTTHDHVYDHYSDQPAYEDVYDHWEDS